MVSANSCCQEPPDRLARFKLAPKNEPSAHAAPTFSTFRVYFTPETPVHFAFRALLFPEIRTRFRVRSSRAVWRHTQATRTTSEGFPLRKGARLDRSPAEPVPSWRFSPLRLSLSSRWTRLPGSSSHVLGGLPAEASCGRNPRPPAPQSLTQRRTRLRAPRPKAGRLSSFPNRTLHPKVLAPFRSREDLHSPEGEWTVPAPLGSATCSPTSAASSVAEGDGSRSRRR